MNGKANQVEALLEDQSVIEQDLELGRVFKTNLTMREVAQLKAPSIKTTEELIADFRRQIWDNWWYEQVFKPLPPPQFVC